MRFPSQLGGSGGASEAIIGNYSIYNIMFCIIYYGVIGKQCFAARWRCISYIEIAPLAPPPSNKQLEATLHFRHSSNFHSIFILKHLIVN